MQVKSCNEKRRKMKREQRYRTEKQLKERWWTGELVSILHVLAGGVNVAEFGMGLAQRQLHYADEIGEPEAF